MEKRNVIVLIGLPGSGKTTLVENNSASIMKTYGITDCISSDDAIQDVAISLGKTYTEVFKQTIDVANKFVESMIGLHSLAKHNFIIDRTNLTIKSRQRTFNLMYNKDEYNKIAVLVEAPDAIELNIRLQERAKEEGKIITPELLKEMQDRYEEPTINEGFDKVLTAQQFIDSLTTEVNDLQYGEAKFG